jgi:hypothetical protein
VSYFSLVAFNSMKPGSQRVLDRFCEQTDKDGQKCGDKSAAGMQRAHVLKAVAARADRPEWANSLRQAARALMQHAAERRSSQLGGI